MHSVNYLLFGLSSAAMFAVLVKTVAIFNSLDSKDPSSYFFEHLNARWWTMYIASPTAFFATLAALVHLMPERAFTFVIYAFFGVSCTLMLISTVAIASCLSKDGGFRQLAPVGWFMFITGPVMFFTSLAAFIHIVSAT